MFHAKRSMPLIKVVHFVTYRHQRMPQFNFSLPSEPRLKNYPFVSEFCALTQYCGRHTSNEYYRCMTCNGWSIHTSWQQFKSCVASKGNWYTFNICLILSVPSSTMTTHLGFSRLNIIQNGYWPPHLDTMYMNVSSKLINLESISKLWLLKNTCLKYSDVNQMSITRQLGLVLSYLCTSYPTCGRSSTNWPYKPIRSARTTIICSERKLQSGKNYPRMQQQQSGLKSFVDN